MSSLRFIELWKNPKFVEYCERVKKFIPYGKLRLLSSDEEQELIEEYNTNSLFDNWQNQVFSDYDAFNYKEYYTPLQLFIYLKRYAQYNETIAELFTNVVCYYMWNHHEGKTLEMEDEIFLFDMLFRQKITLSGHRLLQSGNGDLEACVTGSFTKANLAIERYMDLMDRKLACGIEIIDPNISCAYNLLETFIDFKNPSFDNSTIEYRCNLNVSCASIQIEELLKSLLPNSRNMTCNNLATISIIDGFIDAVYNDREWTLIAQEQRIGTTQDYRAQLRSAKVKKTIRARELFNNICRCINSVGRPSLIFVERMNEKAQMRFPFFNFENRMITTSNLCTEIALPTLDNEFATCNIGCVNVGNIQIPTIEDEEQLLHYIFDDCFHRARALTFIMNTAITRQKFDYSRKYRSLGLGLLGVFDFAKNLCWERYDQVSFEKMKYVGKFVEAAYAGLYFGALAQSVDDARERGSFEGFKPQVSIKTNPHLSKLAMIAEFYNRLPVFEESLRYRFNLTLTAQAPTASMSLFCNTTASIEPCQHNYNIRCDGTMLRNSGKRECTLSFEEKNELSELYLRVSDIYIDQTVSANLQIMDPTKLYKQILDRRAYCSTGLYYGIRFNKDTNLLYCDKCTV